MVSKDSDVWFAGRDAAERQYWDSRHLNAGDFGGMVFVFGFSCRGSSTLLWTSSQSWAFPLKQKIWDSWDFASFKNLIRFAYAFFWTCWFYCTLCGQGWCFLGIFWYHLFWWVNLTSWMMVTLADLSKYMIFKLLAICETTHFFLQTQISIFYTKTSWFDLPRC